MFSVWTWCLHLLQEVDSTDEDKSSTDEEEQKGREEEEREEEERKEGEEGVTLSTVKKWVKSLKKVSLFMSVQKRNIQLYLLQKFPINQSISLIIVLHKVY